jgi:hypothetical protein
MDSFLINLDAAVAALDDADDNTVQPIQQNKPVADQQEVVVTVNHPDGDGDEDDVYEQQ